MKYLSIWGYVLRFISKPNHNSSMTKLCRKNHSQKMEPSTPRRSSRKNSFSRRSHDKNNNPYSTRGLDKFSALLAELEEKRQKIYSQMGSDDISFVRFVYKDSDDCVPIVVKMKKDKQQQDKTKTNNDIKASTRKQDSEIKEKFPVESSIAEINKETKQAVAESDNKISKKKRFSWNIIKLSNWRQPSYYLPATVILILLLLAFFGRSFAILCTSIGWYVIPTLKSIEKSSNVRKSMKKKEYARKFSDNKMATVRLSFNNSGPVKDQSSPKHDHRRSW